MSANDDERIEVPIQEFEDDNPAIAKFYEREDRLWALCKALQLRPRAYGRLHDICYGILQQYTLKKYQAGSDYTRSRELLPLLAKQADELFAGLQELRTDFRIELLYARHYAEGAWEPDGFCPRDLETELHDFALAARDLAKLTPSRTVGTPGAMLLRSALEALVKPIEHFIGEDVKYTRLRRGFDDPHFIGSAGRFLSDFWLTFDPKMTERQLANAMRNLRERARKTKAKPKQNPTENCNPET